jgi:hypothetical protein
MSMPDQWPSIRCPGSLSHSLNIWIHVCVCVYIYIYMHTRRGTACFLSNPFVYWISAIHTRTHTYTDTNTPEYAHTHTYTYKHIYTQHNQKELREEQEKKLLKWLKNCLHTAWRYGKPCWACTRTTMHTYCLCTAMTYYSCTRTTIHMICAASGW